MKTATGATDAEKDKVEEMTDGYTFEASAKLNFTGKNDAKA